MLDIIGTLLIGLMALFGAQAPSFGASTFNTTQGGTGTSSPSGILYGDGTTALKTVTIGSNLTFSGGTLTSTGGGSSFDYPFPSNATSTSIDFTGGLQVGGWDVGTTTAIVCKQASMCQYTTIQSAIDAGWRDIFVKDGTYAEQITMANTKTKLRAQSLLTIIQCNGSTQSPCVDLTDESIIDGFTLNETNGTLVGVAIDASDNALTTIAHNRINNFATSTQFSDTTSNTFYNRVEDNYMADTKTCFEFSGTQANANWLNNNRCRPMSVAGGYGLYVSDARGIYMSGGDIEGTTTSATNIGIYFDPSSRDNKISGVWQEAMGTGLSIASGANNIQLDGTTITSNGTDISDSGTGTILIGVNRTGTKITQFFTTLFSGVVTLTNDLLLSGASADITSDTDIDLYPGNQSTRSLRVSDNGSTISLSSTGNTSFALADSLNPLTNNTYDLGTDSLRWNNIVSTHASTSHATSTTSQYFPFLADSAGTFVAVDPNGRLIATSSPSGSGTVTSVGLSLPTGFTVTNSPVTTTGTLTGALDSGFSVRKLPSYVVAASGGDFTTIQGALDQCGVDGGGNIYLTDSTYAQGGTGLTFKGSNCNIYGRTATTTITFTGATTLFKTNSAAGTYSNNGVHSVVITGDGNASSIVFDWSDMIYQTYSDIVVDNVGTFIRINDTQNITFYNQIENFKATTIVTFGVNASSTNPTNANRFINGFLGCAANCTGMQFNNSNGSLVQSVRMEPASDTGTVGIDIFDSLLATNDGVFGNTFEDLYIEGNAIGIRVANTVGSGGGIKRNIFNGMVETNTTDLSLGSNADDLNTFYNVTDSNFNNAVTSFQKVFGIGTTSPAADFAVAGSAFVDGIARFTGQLVTKIAAAFTPSIEGEIGIDTTNNQFKYYSGSAVRVIPPTYFGSFSFSTTTAWTGTTTIPLGPAGAAETWSIAKCFTDTGTVNVSFYDGTNRMNIFNASTTVGTVTLSTNNTFTSGEKRYVDIGTPASSPTNISCTVGKTYDAT